jgi:hypothetical protein
MSTKSKKAKARRLQDRVVKDLYERFPGRLKADDIRPALMGERGVDIKVAKRAREVVRFAIECKNQEQLSIFAAIEQAEYNAVKEGLPPAVVFSRNRAEPWVAIRWEELLELLGNLYDSREESFELLNDLHVRIRASD